MKYGFGLAAFAAAIAVAAPAHADPEANKQLVERFIHDVFVERNAEAARKYLAPEYIQHNAHVAPGTDGFVKSIGEWLSHAPADFADENLHLVAEGDLVVAHNRLTFTGKDGKKVSVTGFDLYRVRNGKIVEHWDSDN